MSLARAVRCGTTRKGVSLLAERQQKRKEKAVSL